MPWRAGASAKPPPPPLDADVPIEVSEVSKDATILAFAWEPKGIRFAVIHSEVSSAARTDVSFYTMGSKHNGRVSLLKTLDKKQWSAPPNSSRSFQPQSISCCAAI